MRTVDVRALVEKGVDPESCYKFLVARTEPFFAANGLVASSGAEVRKTLMTSNNNHKRLDTDDSTGVVLGRYPASWGILAVA